MTRMKTLRLSIFCLLLLSCTDNDSVTKKSIQTVETTKSVDKDTVVTKIFHAISLDTTNIYPFDTILDNYISAGDTMGSGTNDMISWFYNATKKLDSLVEIKYNKLIKRLDKEDQAKLKLSQDNWKKYRDAEADFLMSAYYTWANASKYGHGREHSITQAEWRYSVVRLRLIALTKYNDEIYDIDDH